MKKLSRTMKSFLGMLLPAFLLILFYQNCNLAPVHDGEFVLGSELPGLGEGERIEIDAEMEQKALAVIESRCLSCHNNSFAEFGINVEGDTLALLARNLVVPGIPEGSSLYRSVISKGRAQDGISPMPIGNPLAQDEIEILEKWISQGIVRITDPSESGETELYNYIDNIEPLLQKHACLSCHSSNSGNSATDGGYIILDNYERVMEFVDVGSEDSLLLDSITSGRMPKGRTKVNDEEINVIRLWILQGALKSAP